MCPRLGRTAIARPPFVFGQTYRRPRSHEENDGETPAGRRYCRAEASLPVPGGPYIKALIPVLTSLFVHHSGKCIKQMQLSEERGEEWPGLLFNEPGLEPPPGCWETHRSEMKSARRAVLLLDDNSKIHSGN